MLIDSAATCGRNGSKQGTLAAVKPPFAGGAKWLNLLSSPVRTTCGSFWETALSGAKILSRDDIVRIVGWQPQLLYFPDELIGPSVSPSIARAISSFHWSLSRAVAFAIYGKPDARRLHAEDEHALDLTMLVVDGSNGFEVVGEAIDRLANAVISKLTGRQMALLIAILLLGYFGQTVNKDWIQASYAERAREGEARERLKLSEEETRRMKLFADALTANPGLRPLVDLANEAKPPLVRSIIPYGRGSVLGTEISEAEARVIVSKDPPEGVSKRLDGRFEVVEIDIENPEGYMGTLRDIKTQREVKVSINRGEIPETDIETLFAALRGKRNVDALVNAWMVGDKINYASVVRADPVNP